MWKKYNANPESKRGNDCTVRAISVAMRKTWEEVYLKLCLTGFKLCDMPSSNLVWGTYLTNEGYTRHMIPNTCPCCYTVKRFAEDHPNGTYILALNGHVVAVIDGNYIDTWDSGNEEALYFWKKGD